MEFKTLEVRDRATYIGVLAYRLKPNNRIQEYYIRRSGHSPQGTIVVMRLDSGFSCFDPYGWVAVTGARTMKVAHQFIEANFNKLHDGSVVDVEYILGESNVAKESERIEYPMG